MKEEKENQATDSISSLKFAGREFPDTPEGRQQLEEYGQQLSTLLGRQSNEVGQARKSLAKYQRMVSELPEPVKLILESEDASQEAKLLAQFMAQDKLKAAEKEETSLRDSWYQQASEEVLKELPELKDSLDADLIDAVLRKHALHESEDPLGEAKRLFEKRVKRAAPQSQDDAANVSVDGSAPRAKPTGGKQEKDSKGGEAADIDAYFLQSIGAD
jgi:hypothetical protein